MASKLTAQVATTTSTRTSGKSDAVNADVIKWALADKVTPPDGLTTAQLNQWWLDQYVEELVRYTMQEARRNRLREKRAQANLEAATETEIQI